MARFGKAGNGDRAVLVHATDQRRLGRILQLRDLTQHEFVRTLACVDVKLIQGGRRFALPIVHHLDDGNVLATFAQRPDGNAPDRRIRSESDVAARDAQCLASYSTSRTASPDRNRFAPDTTIRCPGVRPSRISIWLPDNWPGRIGISLANVRPAFCSVV